jgi:hypothetical protein
MRNSRTQSGQAAFASRYCCIIGVTPRAVAPLADVGAAREGLFVTVAMLVYRTKFLSVADAP